MRRRSIAAGMVALAAAMACAAPSGAAERLALSEARSPGFPQRAYVLTLPEAQTLPQAELSVSENGEPVEDLKIASLGGQSAVVLAIDASDSMRGKIRDAMAAARAFADRRRNGQRLGVVFFRREPDVALEPTTDAAAIDRVLAKPPALTQGTRVYDAANSGVEMIRRSGVAAGSVVVLSDGADFGSRITRNELIAGARRAHVRLFGVGLPSPSFDATALRALSTGGAYVEAAQPQDLAGIYARLAERQGREFLVSWRSRQPLESDIAVAVHVTGIRDVVTAAYRTPDFPIPPGLPDPPPTWWESGAATTSVVLIMGLLFALGLGMLLRRPGRSSMSGRISRFTGETVTSADELATQKARELLSAADGRLSRWRPWIEFKLDVELSKLSWPPRRIAAMTMLAMGLVALGFFMVGSPVMAAMSLVGIPIVVRLVIRYLATKTRRRFEDQLPDNLQVMASALRAGHSFVGALSVMVKDAPEPSRKEFGRVVRDEQLGVPVEKSLEVVYERMRCEDVLYVGLLATLQRETGGNTAEVLDKVVETIRERGKLRRLVRTLTAQGRLGGWIVTALPIAMCAFLLTFKPGYLSPMLAETLGWVILIVAAMMVALGAYCIRRIVDIQV